NEKFESEFHFPIFIFDFFMSRHITLITGGARSGKTRYALEPAEAISPRTYIATTQPLDHEKRERAARHQREREALWSTIEEPFELAPLIIELQGLVVIDCLTIWLSNWLLRDEGRLEEKIDQLCSSLQAATCQIRAITNEVGSSIVPENPLARRF